MSTVELKPQAQQVKSREVQELDLMGTIKPDMNEHILKGGIERIIHVDPGLIQKNRAENKNYPTIKVKTKDQHYVTHQCHAVRIMGPAMLKQQMHADDGPVSVYIVTHNELALYTDPEGSSLLELVKDYPRSCG